MGHRAESFQSLVHHGLACSTSTTSHLFTQFHLSRVPLRQLDTLTSKFVDSTGFERMLPTGRGAIAHVEYTGEEAAPEIRKLLGAVVS